MWRIFISGLFHYNLFDKSIEFQRLLFSVNFLPLRIVVQFVLEPLGALPDDDGESFLLVEDVLGTSVTVCFLALSPFPFLLFCQGQFDLRVSTVLRA